MVKSLEQIKKEVYDYRERQKNKVKYVFQSHTEETKQKIKATQQKRVAEGVHNRAIKDTCIYCGLTTQKYMIDRWHQEKCKEKNKIKEWSYVSPKLRGLKVKT